MNDTLIPTDQSPGGGNPPPPAAPASFWGRYSTAIIRLAIVAVVIIGAVIYSKPKTAGPDTSASKEAPDSATSATLPVAQNPASPPTTAADGAAAPKIAGGSITVTALRGNGYTHLARRALGAYLESASSKTELKPEHKIYIEDYLQKRLTKKTHLTAGAEVVFAQADIQQAIDRALKLNDRQLQNLHRYTLRVSNL